MFGKKFFKQLIGVGGFMALISLNSAVMASFGESLYKLPYPSGVIYRVSQGNSAEGNSHAPDSEAEYAFDFQMKQADIAAARNGVVKNFAENFGEGHCDDDYKNKANYIWIDHEDGTSAVYVHLEQNGVYVKKDARVYQGQIIGKSGKSGKVCPEGAGYHLHFHVQITDPDGQDWYTQSLPITFSDPDVYAKNKEIENLPEDQLWVPQYNVSYISSNIDTSINPTDWPVIQYDLANTGSNPDAEEILWPMVNKEKVVLMENVHSYAQPVVSKDIVYVSGYDGRLYAANPEAGYCVWSFDTGAPISTSAAIDQNRIYVLSSNNKLYCLKKDFDFSGQLDWVYDPGISGNYWQTSPQVYENYICFTIAQLPFFINKQTRQKINPPVSGDFQMQPIIATPAIANNIFYVQDMLCRIIAYSIPDGQILWNQPIYPGPQDPGDMFGASTAHAIALTGDLLICKTEWRKNFSNPIFQKNETGFVYAVKTNTENHDILWTKNIGFGIAAPIVKNNIVYIAGSRYYGNNSELNELKYLETKIYYFSLQTGALLDSLMINDIVDLSIGGNSLYLACWNAKGIIAIKTDPFNELWRHQLKGYAFNAVVPVKDRIYVSLLDYAGGLQPGPAREQLMHPKPRFRPEMLEMFQLAAASDNNIAIAMIQNDSSFPVELAGFTAIFDQDKESIILSWTTASETNNLGFNIYRSQSGNGIYVKINLSLIPGQGTTERQHEYQFADHDIVFGRDYFYYIEDVDFNGITGKSQIIQAIVLASLIPKQTILWQNYPNPFNPETWIPFELANESDIRIKIFNIHGNLVHELSFNNLKPGIYYSREKAVHWDGRNKSGELVSSGLYFYQLKTDNFSAMRRMVLVK